MKITSHSITHFLRRIRDDNSGLAVVEFATALPFFLTLGLGGIESANYATTVMQLNQLTIHAADSAGRMGEGRGIQAKTISEKNINDVFSGTSREGASLLLEGQHAWTASTGNEVLRGNALVILSSFEEVANFNKESPKYRIRWQRCLGSADYFTSSYGTPTTATNVVGIGPSDRLLTPPKDGAIMFVETQYWYQAMALGAFGKIIDHTMSQVAATTVRDFRDLNPADGNAEGITNSEANGSQTCHFND